VPRVVAKESYNSAVGKTTGCELNDQGDGVESRQCQELPLLHVVQTDSGAHSALYTMATGSCFPGGGGVKWPKPEADNSPPPTSAEVKKSSIHT
jgi:hypothetical protein